MNPTDWAYLAGLVDGEGTFFLGFDPARCRGQPNFRPLVALTLNEREGFLLEEFRKALNGRSLWHDKKRHALSLKFTEKATVRFLIENLLLYLKLKREHAELLLEAVDIMDKIKPPHARAQEDILKLAKIRDKIHELSSGKRPKQRSWTYESIKEYIEKHGYGTKGREEARFKKYIESGIPTRFKKVITPP